MPHFKQVLIYPLLFPASSFIPGKERNGHTCCCPSSHSKGHCPRVEAPQQTTSMGCESVSEPICAWHCSRCGVRTTNRTDMGPALKGSTFCKSWAPGLRPAHRLLLLTFLSSRLFKALLTTSPQPSSLVFDGICWVSQNLLGSIGPSSGQREAFEDAHLQGCL